MLPPRHKKERKKGRKQTLLPKARLLVRLQIWSKPASDTDFGCWRTQRPQRNALAFEKAQNSSKKSCEVALRYEKPNRSNNGVFDLEPARQSKQRAGGRRKIDNANRHESEVWSGARPHEGRLGEAQPKSGTNGSTRLPFPILILDPRQGRELGPEFRPCRSNTPSLVAFPGHGP